VFLHCAEVQFFNRWIHFRSKYYIYNIRGFKSLRGGFIFFRNIIFIISMPLKFGIIAESLLTTYKYFYVTFSNLYYNVVLIGVFIFFHEYYTYNIHEFKALLGGFIFFQNIIFIIFMCLKFE
jgi:hypothetical protein